MCANSWCHQPFEVTADDLKFYEEVSPVFNGKKEPIPPPTLCPDCRMQGILSFRNEYHLYRRSDKNLLSIFAPESPFPILDNDAWWSDQWDAISYGRDFDFGRPFFPQFHALQLIVPRLHLFTYGNENSDYVNYSYENKNCYLGFGARSCEDAFYVHTVLELRNCLDMLFCERCELCYECINCNDCYGCVGLQECSECRECAFCSECIGCASCFGCCNLRNKSFCYFNEPLTQKEYEEKTREHHLSAHRSSEKIFSRSQAFHRQQIHRGMHLRQCENCTGDDLVESKASVNCFDGFRLENCKDGRWFFRSRDCRDVYAVSDSDWIYQAMGISMHHGVCCASTRYCNDLLYCDHCFNSKNCFGCVGLHHKQYCILNKQYTKEEYEKLVPKIIEHMQETGEWGEFFPISLSLFAYNETVAQEYFPLTKEEVLKRGWKWRDEKDEMPKVSKVIPASKLPDSIDAVPDDILNWAIECEVTKRPFRIIKQEFEFYRKMRLPIPHFHPDERHLRRMALRNPRKLWKRACMKCQKPMETTYAPECPEVVYCEECYLKEVY
jgi:hypothetical protein